jgi:hypothetical protein
MYGMHSTEVNKARGAYGGGLLGDKGILTDPLECLEELVERSLRLPTKRRYVDSRH